MPGAAACCTVLPPAPWRAAMLQAGVQSQRLLARSVAVPCFPCFAVCQRVEPLLCSVFPCCSRAVVLLTEVGRVCLLFAPQAEGELGVLHFVPTCFLLTKRCFQHCVHQTVLALWSGPVEALKPQPSVHSNWEDLETVCGGIWLKHRLGSAGVFPSPPPPPQHRLRQELAAWGCSTVPAQGSSP